MKIILEIIIIGLFTLITILVLSVIILIDSLRYNERMVERGFKNKDCPECEKKEAERVKLLKSVMDHADPIV